MKRIISVLLIVASVFCAAPINVFAAKSKEVLKENLSLVAYNENINASRQLCVKNINGQIYIEKNDLMFISCCKEKTLPAYAENCVAVRNGKIFLIKDKGIEYTNGRVYYPLEKSCEDLNVSVYYEPKYGLLYCKYYLTNEELGKICSDYLNTDALQILFVNGEESTALWLSLFMGCTYNVVSNLRVDALVGVYQQEMYEKACWEIVNGTTSLEMEMESNRNSLTDTVSDFKKRYPVVKKALSLFADIGIFSDNLDKDGTDAAAYYILDHYSDSSNLVDVVKKSLSVDEKKVAREIVDDLQKAEQANLFYSNALYYTFRDDEKFVPSLIKSSAANVYSRFSTGHANGSYLVNRFIKEAAKSAAKKGASELAGMVINTELVALEKVALDALGIGAAATGAEQMLAAADIQKVAKNKAVAAYNRIKNGTAGTDDAVTLKYATGLFIRCYQYAHEAINVDSSVSFAWFVDDETMDWTERRTREYSMPMITSLASLNDDELNVKVVNNRIDPGALPPYSFDPDSVYVVYNPAREKKECSKSFVYDKSSEYIHCYDICAGDDIILDSFAVRMNSSDNFPTVLAAYKDEDLAAAGEICCYIWIEISTPFNEHFVIVYDTLKKTMKSIGDSYNILCAGENFVAYEKKLNTSGIKSIKPFESKIVGSWAKNGSDSSVLAVDDPLNGVSMVNSVRKGDYLIFGFFGGVMYYDGHMATYDSKYAFEYMDYDRSYVHDSEYVICCFDTRSGGEYQIAVLDLQDIADIEKTDLTDDFGIDLYEIKSDAKLKAIFRNLQYGKVTFRNADKFYSQPQYTREEFLKKYPSN